MAKHHVGSLAEDLAELSHDELVQLVLDRTRSHEVALAAEELRSRIPHEEPPLPDPSTMTDEQIRHELANASGDRYKLLLAQHRARKEA